MGLADKYRLGNKDNSLPTNIEIENLSTLESIKSRQGWMIASQIATVLAVADQTKQTKDALNLVNNTLVSIEHKIENGFDSLEASIESLESNLIENLSEIKWYLFNIDKKLDQLINLIKFSGATKSAEYNKQGFILYKIGIYKDAIGQLEKSLDENPLNIEAYINLGFVYLRLENLSKSVENFEIATKIIKEDFSYYEEISSEQIEKTKIFILDNLSDLYALQDKNHKSIELLNEILSKNVDKKTEITTKYKIAKYKCLNQEHKDALEIINEFINNQYFEPVALAVSSPEFKKISSNILETLQVKLEAVKKSYSFEAETNKEKINLFEIDLDFKTTLINTIEKLYNEIKESSNYSILLSSDFKEKHNDFLQFIDLLSELKSKTEIGLKTSIQDNKKLRSIAKYNANILTDYDKGFDVAKISHRILLKEIKSNVESGIDKKTNLYNQAQKLYEKAEELLNEALSSVTTIKDNEIIEHINTKFDLHKLSNNLLHKLNNKINDNNFIHEIIKDYSSIINGFNSKEKIENKSSHNNSYENEKLKPNLIEAVKIISNFFNMTFDKAVELVLDKKRFKNKFNLLSKEDQNKIASIIREK